MGLLVLGNLQSEHKYVLYVQRIYIWGDCMSSKKKSSNKKDSQLLLRINREERDEFVAICEDMDTSAAREIRKFIKQYIATHKNEDASSS